MTRRDLARTALPARLGAIGVAMIVMISAIVGVQRWLRPGDSVVEGAPFIAPALPESPIAAESLVFRTRAEEFAVGPDARRRFAAHPRTLATYRRLRAFPGAPPRVPHGLTSVELRSTTCSTCHERGGYSQRFGAYAPLTPHPELVACLQCHVVDAAVAGTPLPAAGPDDRCRQCHAPDSTTSGAPVLDWRPAAWPEVSAPAIEGEPPAIPHLLQFRENCLACHAGPGAVAEIRTTHPERASCRQCHVTSEDGAPAYVRPGPRRGGAP
jgi:cytochrome c-type protein NapB